ncbi:hypothetical protein Tdes44962_MAKER08279 [Teratosphaeria destructans]|uniref:Uncharacterized protein n=1 Tax=Teratosphaeria destructans TaxID=418781 RepID=A0A9W7W4V4_9PEZI|nr:hypothetical protein Tdes44962_MAKER08279 [Teratosphaeria destructans]
MKALPPLPVGRGRFGRAAPTSRSTPVREVIPLENRPKVTAFRGTPTMGVRAEEARMRKRRGQRRQRLTCGLCSIQ